MSRRRSLSDEEHTLWSGYIRSITPLQPAKLKSGKRSGPKFDDKPEIKTSAAVADKSPVPSRSVKRQMAAAAERTLPLAPFDRRLKQRVARGRDSIDARIDLHGMTQREAHAALLHFLGRVQSDGKRMALVVTGKGVRTGSGVGERGVLRRQVPLWFSLPEFRRYVVGFEEAHASHGGQGALYVRLRRAR
jgi:DNA-nicking Smr family endonuclease